MEKSHYNILFPYLGCKGMSFSLNTLENHAKKPIQKQNAGLKKEFTHISLSPLVQKTGDVSGRKAITVNSLV